MNWRLSPLCCLLLPLYYSGLGQAAGSSLASARSSSPPPSAVPPPDGAGMYAHKTESSRRARPIDRPPTPAEVLRSAFSYDRVSRTRRRAFSNRHQRVGFIIARQPRASGRPSEGAFSILVVANHHQGFISSCRQNTVTRSYHRRTSSGVCSTACTARAVVAQGRKGPVVDCDDDWQD